MQHIPTAPTTSEHPQRDWIPAVAYLLVVALLLVFVGLLLWPSWTPATTRDSAYVNPELRLAERFRLESARPGLSLAEAEPLFLNEETIKAGQASAPNYYANPELLTLESFRNAQALVRDFEHANPEVGLFQRLQEMER